MEKRQLRVIVEIIERDWFLTASGDQDDEVYSLNWYISHGWLFLRSWEVRGAEVFLFESSN